ncbi:3-keto-disaccharide hydrolase [Planctomicrobium sp. SH527]|uniref:3-keto-disaccharide hydrolase n=1 Tax=Planctomicrobium sp. SH527 TaxID=3448123 RepID=UPI003F5BA3D1
MLRSLALFAVLAVPCFALAETPKTAPEETGDYKTIFNGKDLSGWDGDPTMWSVRDGVIHGETTAENAAKGNTFLIWRDGKTGDFELRLSFRCNATNNSGIQYRSRRITDSSAKNSWVVRGYQHELRNEVKFPNVPSFIYDEGGKRGRICQVGEETVWGPEGKKVVRTDLVTQEEFEKLFNLDGWNDVVIIGKGNRIQHYLNGKLMIDFTDDEPKLQLLDGVLALQLHAGKPMWAEFKNIRIKDLK